MRNLEEITTEMGEYVCDTICRFPGAVGDKEVLEEICAECRVEEFICSILNREKIKRKE